MTYSWRNHRLRNISAYDLRSCLTSQMLWSWNHYAGGDQHIWWLYIFCKQVKNSQRTHCVCFKHSHLFSFHTISTQMCPLNFWTIALCHLKQVLTRHLITITLVSVPVVEGKLFWITFIIWISCREGLLATLDHINFLSPFSAHFHASSLLSDYPLLTKHHYNPVIKQLWAMCAEL